MATLGDSQRPMVMPHYPHMLAEDVAVWTAFLQRKPDLLKEVWYDVHVGKPMPLPVGANDVQRAVAFGVSRKRIDVVARTEDAFWVIEVKPYGNMVALGQAVAYIGLFEKEFEVDLELIPVVVCMNVDVDLEDEFERQGVSVVQVELL